MVRGAVIRTPLWAAALVLLLAAGAFAWWHDRQRDAWIDRINAAAAQDTARAVQIEGLRAKTWELASFVGRSAREVEALARDTGKLAAENRRLGREVAVAVRSRGEIETTLSDVRARLVSLERDTLRLELSGREDFEAGFVEIDTRLVAPLADPASSVAEHDLRGEFAVDVRLLVEEDGTPVCQVSVPGDVLALMPDRCVWRDMRPGPAGGFSFSANAKLGGGAFLAGLVLGLLVW